MQGEVYGQATSRLHDESPTAKTRTHREPSGRTRSTLIVDNVGYQLALELRCTFMYTADFIDVIGL